MELFVVEYEPGGRGCPPVLRGRLNHPWEWDEHDPDPSKFEITHNYVYESKHAVVDFDYCTQQGVASRNFVDLCLAAGAKLRLVPVEIRQTNGQRTVKDYFYPLWANWLSILDVDASDVELERQWPSGEPAIDRYFPDIQLYSAIRRFVADLAKLGDERVFKCVDLGSKLVCTADFRADCETAGLIGLRFTPLSTYQKTPILEVFGEFGAGS